jgi:hypothetical protein
MTVYHLTHQQLTPGAPLASEKPLNSLEVASMRKTIWVLLITLGWSCGDGAGPPGPVPTSRLHFVMQDSTAPPLLTDSVGFYARVGEDRRVALFYQGSSPGDTGETFLEFEVRPNGLLKRPDGSAFQPGDSILISLAVVDPRQFIFTFGPPGLQFNPADPARLHIEYYHSDHDFNGDGHVDAGDDAAEGQLGVWQREPPDTLWGQIGSAKNEETDEIEATILSFTQFAVAW